jgi:hypothetical protein
MILFPNLPEVNRRSVPTKKYDKMQLLALKY